VLLAAIFIVALKEAHGKIGLAQDAVLHHLTGDYTLVARFHNIPALAIEASDEALRQLQSDPLVARIDPDSGGSGGDLESLPLIGGDKAHAYGLTGRGVTVAILDSGVDESHPDLRDAIVDEQCFCRNSDGTGCCPNGKTTQSGAGAAADDHGHGSNVAGIIRSAGVVAPIGVAPGVNLVVVKVLDKNNRFASTAQIVAALDWLIDNHPEVRVINMSVGTDALFSSYCDASASFTMALAAAINTLRSGGALAFVSSGNDASSTSMAAPACVQNAISVGAVYDSNVGSVSCDATTTADQITCFTNSNSTLDLVAPGAIITSDWLHGQTSNFIGTSQAAPHAAGSAALLLEARPSLTPDLLESLLKSSGKLVVDARNGVVVPRVDVGAAVSAIESPVPRRRAAHP